MTPGKTPMESSDLDAILEDIEGVAERARASGFPHLRTGLLAVAVATLMGLEDEAIEALDPIVSKAHTRAQIWLGRPLPFFDAEETEEPS